MKKIFFFLLVSAFFTSCDFVGNPYPEKNANLGDTATCPSAVFPPFTASGFKKILIEDFTGHTCPNCPKAADTIEKISNLYPGKIIAMALHIGNTFAPPAPGHGGTTAADFLDDYRTKAGNEYEAIFKADPWGLPAMMYNRQNYDDVSQTHFSFYNNWTTDIAPQLSQTADIDLQMVHDYDASTRKICLAIKDSFRTTMTANLRLVVLLTQDSIVGWQDLYGTQTSNYVHQHMLRDAINPLGALGEPLTGGTINAGTTQIRHFAYNLPTSFKNGDVALSTPIPCDEEHIHIIAFIYKEGTYEILQVEELKLIP